MEQENDYVDFDTATLNYHSAFPQILTNIKINIRIKNTNTRTTRRIRSVRNPSMATGMTLYGAAHHCLVTGLQKQTTTTTTSISQLHVNNRD